MLKDEFVSLFQAQFFIELAPKTHLAFKKIIVSVDNFNKNDESSFFSGGGCSNVKKVALLNFDI